MKLSIHSIEKTLFAGSIKSLTLKTASGEITVLDNHLPLVSVVKPGKIYYNDLQNKEGELFLTGGIMEVKPESEVVILANPI